MKRSLNKLLTALLVLLLGLYANPCRGQNEAQLLHCGLLLGYTGGIEDQAMLLAPATLGQVYAGGRPAGVRNMSFNLRLGTLSLSDSGIYEGGAFIGLSLKKTVHDYFSLRGSLDYGKVTYSPDSYLDEDLTSLKISLLAHPAQGDATQYFNPYLGLGAELDDFGEIVFGIHALAGAEYVFDSVSIGIEAS